MMRSGVLATKHMPETHTGLHIAQRIDQIRNEFGIAKENVAGITRDNAANMDVAMAELGFPDTSCFGHTLQLAINAALNHPEIQACITACRNCCDSLQSFYQINRRAEETSSRKAHSPTTRCGQHVGILHIT